MGGPPDSPASLLRCSPVRLPGEPSRVEQRNGWTVALELRDEGAGPNLVDLSHCARWDLQDSRLDEVDSPGWAIPAAPGGSRLVDGVLINRMSRTQASVWHLHGCAVAMPRLEGLTDVTDASLLVGLLGCGAVRVAERLSNLDFGQPRAAPPFLLQGPWAHVASQVVILAREPGPAALLLSCPRGYARDMVAAILQAGVATGLRPAGEDIFQRWLRAAAMSVPEPRSSGQ